MWVWLMSLKVICVSAGLRLCLIYHSFPRFPFYLKQILFVHYYDEARWISVHRVQTETAWNQIYLYTQSIYSHIIHLDCSTFDLKTAITLNQGFVVIFMGHKLNLAS